MYWYISGTGNNFNLQILADDESSIDFKDMTNAELIKTLQEYKDRKKKPGAQSLESKTLDRMSYGMLEILNQIKSIRVEMSKSNQTTQTMLEKIHTLENEKAELQTKVNTLEERVETLETTVDNFEQRQNSTKITIKCNVPAPRPGTPPSINDIKNFIKMQLNLSDADVNAISIRKLGTEGDRYLLDVGSTSLKSTIFRKCKELEPDEFYLNEFLTMKRSKLMYDLRKKKRDDPNIDIQRVYSFNGNIFIKKRGNTEPLLIKSMTDYANE